VQHWPMSVTLSAPEASGYKQGMTFEQYFEHLC
jgi:hypothetical protein